MKPLKTHNPQALISACVLLAGDGACFPIHVDSEESIDGRRLTAILYLNPEWAPAHGGQLRLYPPGAQPVDVAPLNDRLVIFESHRLLHR